MCHLFNGRKAFSNLHVHRSALLRWAGPSQRERKAVVAFVFQLEGLGCGTHSANVLGVF